MLTRRPLTSIWARLLFDVRHTQFIFGSGSRACVAYGHIGRMQRFGASRNVLAETINGLYKDELIHRRAPWKTKASLELPTLEWVSWFSHHRLREPIGHIPRAEVKANYRRHFAEQAVIGA